MKKQIVTEILAQLGNNKFLAMTGAKNLRFDNDENENTFLLMDLPKNGGNVNRFKVTYNKASDLYDIEFYKESFSRKTFEYKTTNKKVFEGVYNDQLKKVFTNVTGFYTSL